MLTSASLTAFDPRGVRYQASVTRAGDRWVIGVETLPTVDHGGSFVDAVDFAETRLERAVRRGGKPELTGRVA